MSGTFYRKVGDSQPVYTAVLANGDGTLLDLTNATVVLRVKDLASPYGYHEYAGVPDADQVANRGRVTYDWTGWVPTTGGEYWAEWHVNGLVALPTVGSNRISVQEPLADDGLPPMGPVVTLDDVETALMRTLTSAEAMRALQLIDELTSTIEGVLRRDVRVKRRSETGVIPITGKWFPHWGPVIKVESLTVDATDVLADYLADWAWIEFRPGAAWSATYVSGMSIVDIIAVRGVIMKGVAAVILAPPQASAGVLQSYNVEGTSITYGSAVTGGQGNVGRLTVADVASLGLRRKPLIG